MGRRKSLNLFDKIFLVLLGILFVAAFIIACIVSVLSARDSRINAAYHEEMSQALISVNAAQISGDKAISYVLDNADTTVGTYSKDFVPEEFQTDDPNEVRYLLTCVKDSILIGTYSNNSGTGWQHAYRMEITDLKTGESLASETFYGGNPPSSVTKSGMHYGSYPDYKKISQWAADILLEAQTQVHIVTEPVQTEAPTEAPAKPQETQKPTETTAPALSSDPLVRKVQELLMLDIGFSPSYLEYWLTEYEGYTPEEAAYAVENCNADWFEQAVIAGTYAINTYEHIINKEELLWHLIQSDFTEEQAEYAADVLGFY